MIARLRQETVERLAELPGFRRVLDSRQVQIRRTMLPALRVYTSASATNLSLNIVEFRDAVRLTVQVIAEDKDDAANAELVDRLCQAVKARLLCDASWLRMFERVLSLDTELEFNVEGESRTITATMTFTLQVSEVFQPFIPDWLETVRIKVDVISPAADPNTGPPGTPPNVEGGYPGGYPGPDGRIEIAGDVKFPQEQSEE